MTGKCAKCEKLINHVTANSVDVNVLLGTTLKGISYSCPFCHTVLSVQIDPIAIKTDIVNELFKKLRG